MFTFFGNTQECFLIESMLVDACGSPEGKNEMIRIRIGADNLKTEDIVINWPFSTYRGICQNATTADNVAYMNSTVQSCGRFLEPENGILPANAQVLIITSVNFDPTSHEYAGLADEIYVIFQCAGNSTGHLANWINNCDPGSGERTVTISIGIGCSQSAAYNQCYLINQNGGIGGSSAIRDGARVDFLSNGEVIYANDGCTIPNTSLSILATLVYGDAPLCEGQGIHVEGVLHGVAKDYSWSSEMGEFDNENIYRTIYTPNTNDPHYIYFTATTGCGDILVDSVEIVFSPLPTLSIEMDVLNEGCEVGSIKLSASSDEAIEWGTGETTNVIYPDSSGFYTVIAQNQCGSIVDSVFVDLDASFNLNIEEPYEWCKMDDQAELNLTISDGEAPYTLNYSLNGVSYSITSDNGAVTIPITTENVGEQLFIIDSISDALPGCTQTFLDSTLLSIIEIPSINVITEQFVFCQNQTAFIEVEGLNSSPPYTIEYRINDGVWQEIVSEDTMSIVKIQVPTEELGTFNLVINQIIEGSSATCSRLIQDTLLFTIAEGSTAEIFGAEQACQFSKMNVKFSGKDGIPPYLFTYRLNGEEASIYSDNTGDAYLLINTDEISVHEINLITVKSSDLPCDIEINEIHYVEITENPKVDFEPTPRVLYDIYSSAEMINFSAQNLTYIWDFGDDSPLDSTFSPTHDYSSSGFGDYTIHLTGVDYLGCSSEAYKTITFSPLYSIYIPNAFTPDENGVNESFGPIFTDGFDFSTYELIIYNRWGKVVFRTNDVNEEWDGTAKGLPQPTGVYVWELMITYESTAFRDKRTGFINLLR